MNCDPERLARTLTRGHGADGLQHWSDKVTYLSAKKTVRYRQLAAEARV
jgi:hypothetical protein